MPSSRWLSRGPLALLVSFGSLACLGVGDDGVADEIDSTTTDESTDTTDESTDTGIGDPWDPTTCLPPGQPFMAGMLPGSYCALPCVSDLDCPPAPPNVQSACAVETPRGDTLCALLCSPSGMDCPPGASCKDLMDPRSPDAGLCTYP